MNLWHSIVYNILRKLHHDITIYLRIIKQINTKTWSIDIYLKVKKITDNRGQYVFGTYSTWKYTIQLL